MFSFIMTCGIIVYGVASNYLINELNFVQRLILKNTSAVQPHDINWSKERAIMSFQNLHRSQTVTEALFSCS